MYIAQNQGQVAQMMDYIVQNFLVLYDILLHIYHACFVLLRLWEIDLYITHFWYFFRLIEVKEQDEFYLITHSWHLFDFIMAKRARYITHNALFYSTLF